MKKLNGSNFKLWPRVSPSYSSVRRTDQIPAVLHIDKSKRLKCDSKVAFYGRRRLVVVVVVFDWFPNVSFRERQEVWGRLLSEVDAFQTASPPYLTVPTLFNYCVATDGGIILALKNN